MQKTLDQTNLIRTFFPEIQILKRVILVRSAQEKVILATQMQKARNR
ncbi:Uncharacterised protein [uncultured Blautia sp.]|nr:Uncharacterised protein [uncultured Blautia sp.]